MEPVSAVENRGLRNALIAGAAYLLLLFGPANLPSRG